MQNIFCPVESRISWNFLGFAEMGDAVVTGFGVGVGSGLFVFYCGRLEIFIQFSFLIADFVELLGFCGNRDGVVVGFEIGLWRIIRFFRVYRSVHAPWN